MQTKSEVWWLPRPKKNKYKGGVPLHLEDKLFQSLGLPSLIVQPFGGKGDYGIKVDINRAVKPTIVADAHYLPIKNNSADCVFVDPPYSNKEAQEIYQTPDLCFKAFIAEAFRICKPSGYIVVYTTYLSPHIDYCDRVKIIIILTRVFHKARVVCIFKKWGKTSKFGGFFGK